MSLVPASLTGPKLATCHSGPLAPSLLQVSVKEIDEANTIFDELMGDKVEPRRVFIEHNALAASVDV